MELDEFIEATLMSIVRGITRAQADSAVGSFVAPLLQGKRRNDVGNFHLKGDKSRQATVVQFDVQVGTESTRQLEGKTGVKARLYVVDVDLAGGGTSVTGATRTHRLQFAIPIEIPSRVEGG